MHLNYFALRHFSEALHHRLKDCTFINSFSFSKEEIVFSFLKNDNSELFLAVNLINKSCYFRILENYNRPKKNYLYQFEDANGGNVEAVIQNRFDRSFYIKLKTGYLLLFKLHGGFSNIILMNGKDKVEDLFRKEFVRDSDLTIGNLQKEFELDKLLSPDIEEYKSLKSIIPLFDDHCIKFLEGVKFLSLDSMDRKKIIHTYFSNFPVSFYLIRDSMKSRLQIFPEENAEKYEDPLKAYAVLSQWVLPSWQSERFKVQLSEQLNTQYQKIEKRIKSLVKHLENAAAYIEYENLGHIIMANMHSIPARVSQAELFDFYKNKTITVRLDKNLNPQENAEKYYRKAKAHKQEIPELERSLEVSKNELNKIEKLRTVLNEINDLKSLKTFSVENNLLKPDEDEIIFPFRRAIVDGYEVWIGKNAANNDLLTFRYAHKNDVWLHARDVSGSHVIIKNQSGKIILTPTIEKVAAIAAYFSKSKNQNLAVVQYTLKKFVVKGKGRNPGEVNLLSDQTVMVKPCQPN